MNTLRILLCLAGIFGLVACGGGGGSAAAPKPTAMQGVATPAQVSVVSAKQ